MGKPRPTCSATPRNAETGAVIRVWRYRVNMGTAVDAPVSAEQYMRVQNQLIDVLGPRNNYRHHCQLLQKRLDAAHATFHRNGVSDPDLHTMLTDPGDCP